MKELIYPPFVSAIASSVRCGDDLISPHFKLNEFILSDTASRLGIDNSPPLSAIRNLVYLCHYVLEPARVRFGRIHVNSGYRCSSLNEAVGGVKDSYHLFGRAADVYSLDSVSLSALASYFTDMGCKVIRYPTFIHVQL